MSGTDGVLDIANLQSHSFFENLSEKEIRELLRVGSLDSHGPGEYVVRENDTSRDIYIILSGEVRIGRALYAGDEKELTVLGPGEFFGEMGFLDEFPRSASATCVEDATILKIDRDSFQRLAQRRPTIAYKVTLTMARTLSERLRKSNDLLEGIFSNPNRAIVELKTRLLKIQTMLLRR
jgi:CRP/FNR family cyclic AMP-dependent transcriptional regulator